MQDLAFCKIDWCFVRCILRNACGSEGWRFSQVYLLYISEFLLFESFDFRFLRLISWSCVEASFPEIDLGSFTTSRVVLVCIIFQVDNWPPRKGKISHFAKYIVLVQHAFCKLDAIRSVGVFASLFPFYVFGFPPVYLFGFVYPIRVDLCASRPHFLGSNSLFTSHRLAFYCINVEIEGINIEKLRNIKQIHLQQRQPSEPRAFCKMHFAKRQSILHHATTNWPLRRDQSVPTSTCIQ